MRRRSGYHGATDNRDVNAALDELPWARPVLADGRAIPLIDAVARRHVGRHATVVLSPDRAMLCRDRPIYARVETDRLGLLMKGLDTYFFLRASLAAQKRRPRYVVRMADKPLFQPRSGAPGWSRIARPIARELQRAAGAGGFRLFVEAWCSTAWSSYDTLTVDVAPCSGRPRRDWGASRHRGALMIVDPTIVMKANLGALDRLAQAAAPLSELPDS